MYVGSLENDRLMFVLAFSRKEKEKEKCDGRKGKGFNGLNEIVAGMGWDGHERKLMDNYPDRQ